MNGDKIQQDPEAPALTSDQLKAMETELRDWVSKARVRLISRVPFFGYLAMQLRPRMALPQDNVPTAGISRDGTVVCNYDFFNTLSAKQQAWVVAHEVLHPAMQFWQRRGMRNHSLANIAHDLSFNYWIEQTGKGELEAPNGILDDPKFHGMAMEEIYAYLMKGDPGTPGITVVQTHGGGSVTIDVNGDNGGYDDCRDDLNSSKQGQQAANGSKSAQRAIDNNWKLNISAAKQKHEQTKGKGSLPAGLRRWIQELLHPQLEWQELLRRWAGENGKPDDYSFRRPSRRSYGMGVILPGLANGGHADVCFLLDTSGSMSDGELKAGLSEAHGILDEMGSEILAISCDAAVHTAMEIEDIHQFEMKGGGGSNFIPAFDYLQEVGFEGAVIAMTDGMIDVPDEQPHNLKGCLWLTAERYSPPTERWGDHIAIKMPGEE
jgi:predicted metal-dependent peptidase